MFKHLYVFAAIPHWGQWNRFIFIFWNTMSYMPLKLSNNVMPVKRKQVWCPINGVYNNKSMDQFNSVLITRTMNFHPNVLMAFTVYKCAIRINHLPIVLMSLDLPFYLHCSSCVHGWFYGDHDWREEAVLCHIIEEEGVLYLLSQPTHSHQYRLWEENGETLRTRPKGDWLHMPCAYAELTQQH